MLVTSEDFKNIFKIAAYIIFYHTELGILVISILFIIW